MYSVQCFGVSIREERFDKQHRIFFGELEERLQDVRDKLAKITVRWRARQEDAIIQYPTEQLERCGLVLALAYSS